MVGLIDEWIIGRKLVWIAVIDVETQQGSEQGIEVLAVAERIATAAAVAEPGVEHAVGAKADQAAIVVGVGRMWSGDDQLERRGIGNFGVGRRRATLDSDVAVGLRGEIDVEVVISCILRVERDAQ